jgi:hypothetical protein
VQHLGVRHSHGRKNHQPAIVGQNGNQRAMNPGNLDGAAYPMEASFRAPAIALSAPNSSANR